MPQYHAEDEHTALSLIILPCSVAVVNDSVGMWRLELVHNIGSFQGEVQEKYATGSVVPPQASPSAAMRTCPDNDGIHYHPHTSLFNRSHSELWEGTPHRCEPVRIVTVQSSVWTLIMLGI